MVDPDQSWEEFLAGYRRSSEAWRQAPGGLVRRWLPHIDRDHVHVITVPGRGAGRHLLLERFAGVLGLDPAALRTAAADPNTSLDAVEVELLRAVTASTAARLDRRAQRGLINEHLIPLLRGLGPPQARALRLPGIGLRPADDAGPVNADAVKLSTAAGWSHPRRS